MPLLILNFWLYKRCPVKYVQVNVCLSHAILCNVIPNFTQGSETPCKIYTGGFGPLLNRGTKSCFPEGRFSVRMAADLSECLRDPFWLFLSHKMIHLITGASPQTCWDGLLNKHSFFSCWSSSRVFCSPVDNIQIPRGWVPPHPAVSAPAMPPYQAQPWARQAHERHAYSRPPCLLYFSSLCFEFETIHCASETTLNSLKPFWLCPQGSFCFGFSLPTIAQSKTFPSSMVNLNHFLFGNPFNPECLPL